MMKNLHVVDRPDQLDFGSGYGQYKQVFGTLEQQRGSLQIGVTVRGKSIALSQAFLRICFRWTKSAFDWTGIPRWIKKVIRG